ncbi:MAG TPA: VOC family protein [Gemmatimonadales bacterium]|nr:VOC family protein [Gemmatimonadales bacterium]
MKVDARHTPIAPRHRRGGWHLRVLLALAWVPRLAAQSEPQGGCAPPSYAPRLDHVVLVVRNLDSTAAAFSSAGFLLKPGRLHPGNLLNSHIKFRNGTEIELMTLTGPPLDQMARDYAGLLQAGEGGAYVALKTAALHAVAARARQAGLTSVRSQSGAFRFLSFAPGSDAGALFFGYGWELPPEPDSIVAHPNQVIRLAEVWVEGGPRLRAMLQALLGASCGQAHGPDGVVGERWRLGAGSVVVVSKAATNPVPRPLGAVLTSAARGARERLIRPVPNFWLRLVPIGAAN